MGKKIKFGQFPGFFLAFPPGKDKIKAGQFVGEQVLDHLQVAGLRKFLFFSPALRYFPLEFTGFHQRFQRIYRQHPLLIIIKELPQRDVPFIRHYCLDRMPFDALDPVAELHGIGDSCR